ncbi:MAG: pentapeptide repeat-containing protein [Mycobacterium sp.]
MTELRSGSTATACHFEGHDFTDEDLSRLHTERAVFDECNFSGANLAESQHRGSAFRNCTFQRTSLWHWGYLPLAGAVFAQCSMLGSVFVQCRMRPITFDEVDFTLAVLGGNDLRGVDLSGCRLREASLVEADLRKAVLRGADLSVVRATGARLDDADLRGATVDPSLWRTASLAGARVDVGQAVAFAAAQGLRLDG